MSESGEWSCCVGNLSVADLNWKVLARRLNLCIFLPLCFKEPIDSKVHDAGPSIVVDYSVGGWREQQSYLNLRSVLPNACIDDDQNLLAWTGLYSCGPGLPSITENKFSSFVDKKDAVGDLTYLSTIE